MDDVTIEKAAVVERCVARVREVYADEPRHLSDDLLRQDSILLNLQRACEATIDLAMHLVRADRLGVPQESRQAFVILGQHGIIDARLSSSLQRMMGFRNVAVHAYRAVDLAIVRAIIAHALDDLLAFTALALRRTTTR